MHQIFLTTKIFPISWGGLDKGFYCNYLDSLKEAAKWVSDHFGISHINVSRNEFWELITSAKGIDTLEFSWWNIQTDSECKFGDMKNCKMQKIFFVWTGHSSYSNWIANPARFENIIKAISNNQYLVYSWSHIEIK